MKEFRVVRGGEGGVISWSGEEWRGLSVIIQLNSPLGQ